jgi:hypothetical protein
LSITKSELMRELDRLRSLLTALEHDSEKLHSEIRSVSIDFDNLPTEAEDITEDTE